MIKNVNLFIVEGIGCDNMTAIIIVIKKWWEKESSTKYIKKVDYIEEGKDI